MKLLPYIFFFFSFFLFGQDITERLSDKDSLIYYLNNAKGQYKNEYLERAFRLSLNLKNDSLKKIISIRYGINAFFERDTSGLKDAYQDLAVQYQSNADSTLLAKYYHYKALYFRRIFKKDSSFYYYHKSKNVSVLLKDSLEIGRRLLSMGYMQINEADYAGAQVTLTEGLRYLEPTNIALYIGDSYCAIGNASLELGNFEKSRNYYYKSKETFDTIKNDYDKTKWQLIILNNLGNSYLLESNPKKAINFFQEALSITDSIQYNHSDQYRSILGNLADCQYLLGEKDKAFQNFDELFQIRKEDDDYLGLSRSHNGYAHHYELEGDKEKAIFHAEKSYETAKRINEHSVRLSALLKLVRLSNGAKSKEFFKEYVQLDDSLKQKERYLKNQFALVRYETEKVDKKNAKLTLENSEKQAQIERDQLQMIILSLVGIIVVVVLVTYYSNRRKKLMYEAQLQKASAREEERQQIAKSLHDEVAGDLRMLHRKLAQTNYQEEAKSLDKIKENVRNLSHQLSSVSFDEVSFKDQIINLVADSFSLDFRISVEGIDTVLWETVNNAIKRTLYLCARESLQNTLKYAEASKFFIRFSSEKKEILLILEDNGKGFDPSKGKKGIGLKNLKERVEEIQGSYHIETSEQGTKTTISIPINGR